MRQCLAISICIWASTFLIQRRFLFFILGVTLAFCFHHTALVFLVVVPAMLLPSKAFVALSLGSICLMGSNLSPMLDFLSNGTGFILGKPINFYREYRPSLSAFYDYVDVNMIRKLLILFLSIGLLLLSDARRYKISAFLFRMACISFVVLLSLSEFPEIARRLSAYFDWYEPAILVNAYIFCWGQKFKFLMLVGLCFWGFLRLWNTINSFPEEVFSSIKLIGLGY